MRILVVEDDEPLALFLQNGLAAQSYSVELAGDGDEAIRILDQSQYDLVVLDLNLPTTDGLEVLKHIRSKGYGLSVLALSSRRQLEDRVGRSTWVRTIIWLSPSHSPNSRRGYAL